MPKVGTKKFPYTEEGIKEAKEYAKKTGQRLQVEQKRKTTRKTRTQR